VVFTGGSGTGGVRDSVECYDPVSNEFSLATGVLTEGRSLLQALSLRDGRVMVLEGQTPIGGGSVAIVSTVDIVRE